MRKIFLILTFLIFFVNCSKNSTENLPTGIVNGYVAVNALTKQGIYFTSTKLTELSGIEAALVLGENVIKTTSTGSGRFTFTGVVAGSYRIRINFCADFYMTGEVINVEEGKTFNCDTLNISNYGNKENGGKYVFYHFGNPLSALDLLFGFFKYNSSDVIWDIYNLNGEKQKTINCEMNPAGNSWSSTIRWRLRDEQDNVCPAGLYFVITNDSEIINLSIPMQN